MGTLDRSKMIIVSTPAPSPTSTTIPTKSAAPSVGHTEIPSLSLGDSDRVSSVTTVEMKRKIEFNINRLSLYIVPSLILVAVGLVAIILWVGKRRQKKRNIYDKNDSPTISDPECGRGPQTDDDSTDSRTTSNPKGGESPIDDVRTGFEDNPAVRKRLEEEIYSDISFDRMESIPID